ncbi:MAG: pyrimidine-nucleoside phosphorylase [Tissierellia bacterium]|nr:pyrimidine-nucleoside phosphorylase [Tissierellia bacterium]
MNMYDIIEKKRDFHKLSKEEIEYVVNGYVDGSIPDYQVAAFLMAVFLNKFDIDETFYLTDAFIDSGHTIDLSEIKGIKVDKHSTGGVGDKTTLVLGPMVAACGVPFVKMSGRGLGHTGGTLDKLESIKGFDFEISIEEFIKNANEIGMVIASQTGDVTPADKKFYALRDTTATVDNLSLISSSIMSKKLATGADGIVLDVKVGSGAFMKNIEDAEELSHLMIKLGEKYNRETMAVISNMEQPLGLAVGNSLEVIEAIETLRGNGPEDLVELCYRIGTKLLLIAKVAKTDEEAHKMLEETISSGSALEKLKEVVVEQKGDVRYIDDYTLFPISKNVHEIKAKESGYIKSLNALAIGKISQSLGAGRETMETELDLGAGVLLNKKIDDYVEKGELIATLYTNKEDVNEAIEHFYEIVEIGEKNPVPQKIVLKEID